MENWILLCVRHKGTRANAIVKVPQLVRLPQGEEAGRPVDSLKSEAEGSSGDTQGTTERKTEAHVTRMSSCLSESRALGIRELCGCGPDDTFWEGDVAVRCSWV